MYGGKLEQVGLRFTKSLIDEIFDKFGEQTRIDKIDENVYNANVSVQVSRTFFAWVVGTQGEMQIFSPQTVCEQFDKFVATIKERYKNRSQFEDDFLYKLRSLPLQGK